MEEKFRREAPAEFPAAGEKIFVYLRDLLELSLEAGLEDKEYSRENTHIEWPGTVSTIPSETGDKTQYSLSHKSIQLPSHITV